MSTEAVRVILESRLNTWAAGRSPALRVAWENVPFTPATGETYLQAFLLPAPTVTQDLQGSHRGYVGVFQVSIVRPSGTGRGPAMTIAAELNALFPVDGRYTSGSVTVQVVSAPSAGPGIPEPERYVIPVSFEYRADTI